MNESESIELNYDVILIGLESLRADHFSEAYFPQSWDFFEEFAHFTNAYANGVATPLSYQSIHTGYPIKTDSTLPDDKPTIAECYEGYSFAISNNIHLLPSRGYDRGFDYFTQYPREDSSSSVKTAYYKLRGVAGEIDLIASLYDRFWDSVDSVKQPSLTQSKNRAAENVLSRFGDEIISRRGLFWTHIFDTHSPFYPQKVLDRDIDVEYTAQELESMMDRFKSGRPTDEDTDFLQQMYGELIRYVDRQLASFFRRLKRNDRWEDTIIVIFGDHGECFGEENIFGHGWDNSPVDPLIRVPLIVKYPGENHKNERFTHPVQLGDLFATLADLLNWGVDRPPHTRPFTVPETRPVISKSNTAVRVITEDGSAIRSYDGIHKEGEIDSESMSVLNESKIPSADDLSGNIPGLDERAKEEVDKRLEYLGYK